MRRQIFLVSVVLLAVVGLALSALGATWSVL